MISLLLAVSAVRGGHGSQGSLVELSPLRKEEGPSPEVVEVGVSLTGRALTVSALGLALQYAGSSSATYRT